MSNAQDMKYQRSNSIGDKGGDIFDTVKVRQATFREGNQDGAEEEKPLKFLVLPSFMAGVFLGTNNFFLGFISDLGINAATLFSVGAFIFTVLYKFIEALRMKSKYGVYFPYEFSNFMFKNE